MRPAATLLILLLAVGLSAAVWVLSRGHVAVLILPLLVGSALFWRRRP